MKKNPNAIMLYYINSDGDFSTIDDVVFALPEGAEIPNKTSTRDLIQMFKEKLEQEDIIDTIPDHSSDFNGDDTFKFKTIEASDAWDKDITYIYQNEDEEEVSVSFQIKRITIA